MKYFFQPIWLIGLASTLILSGLIILFIPVRKTRALCQRCNIIIVDLDSLRADGLPCFGYHRNTTSAICRLANNGVVFENHFSQSGWTLPNLFSFLTSVNPEIHNVKRSFVDKLDTKIKNLTEILEESGYKTVWAGYTLSAINKENGELKGFSDIYPDVLTPKQWITVTNDLYKTYQRQNTPFFIYLYNSDLHFPYRLDSRDSHEWTDDIPDDFPVTVNEIDQTVKSYLIDHYKDVFSRETMGAYQEVFLSDGDVNQDKLMSLFWSLTSAAFDGTEEEKANILSQLNWKLWKIIYDAYFENVKKLSNQKYGDQVGEFIRSVYDVRLRQIDRDLESFIDLLLIGDKFSNNTIIVFLSDHGDEFMEHGGLEHSTLYNELLRIPLILKVPGISPKRFQKPTQTIDVFPTLFDLVGVRVPESAQGISLVPFMRGDKDKNSGDRYIISSKEDVAAIQNDKWKLIEWYSAATTDRELYYLAEDPGEKENVTKKFPQIVTDLSQKLKEARNIH